MKQRYRIPHRAYGDRKLTGAALRVLMALESHAKPDGSCWPSQGRLGALTGMDRPAANKAIKRLEECGYLVRVGRSGYRSCMYFLTVETAEHSNNSKVDTQSCVNTHTQTSSENISPPVVPPQGDIAASPDGDRSPKRRPRAARKRGGGQAPAPPTPRPPSPATGEGGALVPVDPGAVVRSLARQVAGSKGRATGPPDTPVQRAINSGVLTDRMIVRLIRRATEISEEEACEEFGFTRRGSPKTSKGDRRDANGSD